MEALMFLVLCALGCAVKLLDPVRSSEARGKLGGIIHSTCKGVKYAKIFTSPAQPRTPRQLAIRAYVVQCVNAWRLLDPEQRDAWDAFAVSHPVIDWTGQSITLSGFNWYTGLSVRLLDAAFPVQDDPPVVAAPDAPAGFTAGDGIGQSILTWTPTAGTNLTAEAYMFGPHSAGRVGKLARAIFKARLSGETGTMTVAGLSPGTHTFWLRIMSEDDGQVSPWLVDTALIT